MIRPLHDVVAALKSNWRVRPEAGIFLFLFFAIGTWPCIALAQTSPSWPDSFVGRLEVFALVEHLNGELLASRSATLTLQTWCADHHMAAPARLTAIVDRGVRKPPTPADRSALQIGSDEPLRYRRVRLTCGTRILSEAENWYVPSRLTAGMNRLLETTDMPFGRVVLPLVPTRQTLSVERLWSPLPHDWDRTLRSSQESVPAVTQLVIPKDLFRHRAIVFDSHRRPIALVVETYTNETLNYPH